MRIGVLKVFELTGCKRLVSG